MKVIKKGATRLLPIRKLCRCCLSELEFTEADGYVEIKQGTRTLKVACPECNHSIEVVLSKAPEVPKYTMQALASSPAYEVDTFLTGKGLC